MQFYLQFGHGMMSLCEEFQKSWGNTTVILSPRDLVQDQITAFSNRLILEGGQLLLDPQFYLPRADHKKLISHPYWPAQYDTQDFNSNGRQEMMEQLAAYNERLGTFEFIVPGERATIVDDLWISSQSSFYEAAKQATDMPLLLTICLSADAIRDPSQISLVMELAEKIRPFGYYLVLEHPANQYLIDDPIWVMNTLDLAAGLTLLGGKVVVGYSNQQQLVMAVAGVAAIASGTFKNVRMFPIEKFKTPLEEEDERQRATWYYIPQAYSEFKLPFIELSIMRNGLDPDMIKPDPDTLCTSQLFSAPRMTLSGWKERMAFKHYLTALYLQSQRLTFPSYKETITEYLQSIDQAEELLSFLQDRKVRGGDRNFQVAIEAHRTAAEILDQTYGPRLQRQWNNFQHY